MAWKDAETKRAYERRYYEKNREAVLSYHREWHAEQMAENPEYIEAKRQSARKCNAKRQADPEFAAAKRGTEARRHYEKKYGLSWEDVLAMIEKQGGSCLICRNQLGDDPCVDHDHETGEVRGVLCRLCNTGLGMFRDDPTVASAAVEYLITHKKELRY